LVACSRPETDADEPFKIRMRTLARNRHLARSRALAHHACDPVVHVEVKLRHPWLLL
jgi:hypothetical protein